MLRNCCSGSKVPESMISCEYIRILNYCYVHINNRKTIAFYKLFWMTQQVKAIGGKRREEFNQVPNPSYVVGYRVRISFQNTSLFIFISNSIPKSKKSSSYFELWLIDWDMKNPLTIKALSAFVARKKRWLGPLSMTSAWEIWKRSPPLPTIFLFVFNLKSKKRFKTTRRQLR